MADLAKETDITVFNQELVESLAEQNKKIEEMQQKRKYDVQLLNHTNARNYELEAKMRYHLLCLKESMKQFSYWILVFILFHMIEICFIYYIVLEMKLRKG